MKKLIVLFAFLIISLQAQTKNTLVVVSPTMDITQAKQYYTTIRDVFFNLPVNSSLTVMNGMTGNTVMHIQLPDKEDYNDPKAKNNFEPFHWVDLKKFFKAMPISLDDKQATAGQLDMPRLMSQIERYQDISELIVIGSPLYDIRTNPNMSMQSGLVPSDAYLLNAARNNVFRTQGFGTRLKNISVHWLLFEALPRQVHRDAVQRFWHHYIARQGASLVSFSDDKTLMLQLYKNKAPAMPLPDRLETNGKLEMQAIDDINVSINLYDAPISKEILSFATLSQKQPITIGISWQSFSSVDLDIHAKPEQGKRIYFDNQTSSQGKFYKGKTEGAEDNKRHETIVFHAPIDIKTLQLAVNLYSVNGDIQTPISGELRVKLQGKVYAQSFHFHIYKGNLGIDTETAITTDKATLYTKLFRVAEIVNPPQAVVL